MFKKIGFWITIFFLLLAIISLVMYLSERKTEVYAEGVIAESSADFKTALNQFLGMAKTSVLQLQKDAFTTDIDLLPTNKLHTYFSEFIQGEKNLHGIVLFGSKMNYVMIRDQKSWIVTHNFLSDSVINWQRLDNHLKKLSDWTETSNAFMDAKNFGLIKIPDVLKEEYVWISPKSDVKERRNLLLNIFRLKDGVDFVALVYKTGDLTKHFNRVLRYENPLVSMIAGNGNLISPMLTDDTTQLSLYSKLETEVHSVINTWNETERKVPHSYSFDKFQKEYWCRIDTILPQMGINGFAITVSNNDLLNTQENLNQAYLYASITFLLFALFVYLTSFRKRKPTAGSAFQQLSPLSIEEALSLIKKGETEHVEFKSSLRWDFREEKPNKVLEEVILKSIAAFSNAKGGTLFIGVTDELKIIGLEHDFKTLKKQDADYFELHLRKLINNQYGIRFANKHLHIQFPKIENKILCIVVVAPGDKPLYLKTKNKQGQEVEKFYVRSGNGSQEITSLKEVQEYVSAHFKAG
jgi:hypothetical protein